VLVEIQWGLVGRSDVRWEWTRCLYAYVRPTRNELLYIGKTDGSTTVRKRVNAPDKHALLQFFELDLGVTRFHVVVGDLLLDGRLRLTPQLLADVESLLITRTKPVGNISAIR